MSGKQFHIFHAGHNLSFDQLALIAEEVNRRRRILKSAMENLSRAMDNIEPARQPAGEIKPEVAREPRVNKTPPSQPVKKTDVLKTKPPEQKALKGRVSYKVKGPDGRLMNIAEIKAKIDSIYDGKQGIIKQ